MGLYCSAGNAQRDQCTIRSQALQSWCQATEMLACEIHRRGSPKYTSHCVTNPLHGSTSTWQP